MIQILGQRPIQTSIGVTVGDLVKYSKEIWKSMTTLTSVSQGQMCTRDFDQDSEEWLERLPNQFFGEFDTGVGGYT
jgi:hypothetical protein